MGRSFRLPNGNSKPWWKECEQEVFVLPRSCYGFWNSNLLETDPKRNSTRNCDRNIWQLHFACKASFSARPVVKHLSPKEVGELDLETAHTHKHIHTLHYINITFHYIPLHSITFHYIPFHTMTIPYRTIPYHHTYVYIYIHYLYI